MGRSAGSADQFRWVALWLALLWFWAVTSLAAPPDFTSLVRQLSPSVVNISTTKEVTRASPFPPGMEIPEGSPFSEFFKHFFEQMPNGGAPQTFKTRSLGSGFIISADGYIVSNHHVIEDADEIIVRLQDRRELVAKLVGSDPRSDIALLKVEARDLPAVKMGDPSRLDVGSWVLAIGSPFGFDHSVTAGIVSAKGRSVPSDRNETYVPFIQTDVAINPGNSGGPLFNLEGEVVGINSMIYSGTGGFMGLSFSIPADLAMEVVDQLRSTGRVTRAYLGVLIQEVTRDLATALKLDRPAGALVSQVMPDTPAARAGIQAGDVIIRAAGREIETSDELPAIIGRQPLSRPVEVVLLRAGKRVTLQVNLAELPEQVAQGPGEQISTPAPEPAFAGITVMDATPAELKAEGLEGGVKVTAVAPGSAAADSGLRPGDFIVRFNNQAVTGVSQFQGLTAGVKSGQLVAMLAKRGEGSIFLAMRVP